MLTHNIWFCYFIIPKIFGYNIINSTGRSIDTVDIAMLHVSEDFRGKFIPTVQDYLKHMEVQPWMCNGVQMLESEEGVKAIRELHERIENQ